MAVENLEKAVEIRVEPVGRRRLMLDLAEVYFTLERNTQAKNLFNRVLKEAKKDGPNGWVWRKAENGLKRLKTRAENRKK